jgi:hypothetical protein
VKKLVVGGWWLVVSAKITAFRILRSFFATNDQLPTTNAFAAKVFMALLLTGTAMPFAQQKPSPIKKGDLADKSKNIDLTPGLQDYCRLLYGCKLKVPEGACPSPEVVGKGEIVYDNERCSEAREFSRRGIGPDHPNWGYRLYRFLGFEYRVTYEIVDTLPISRARLEYLMQDIPLAARLVTHYQKEPYTAEYVDFARTHFKGTNGKRMRGEAKLISGGFDEMQLYYLGSGTVEWGPWTLVGPAMMDFKYWEVAGGKKVAYRAKILVFPGNSVINSIMNLGLFRGLVKSKITGVLTDISETAKKLQANGGNDLRQSAKWSANEKKKIETLLQIP